MSYISQTKEFIAQAKSLIDSGAIEARVRENFASYLRTMFPPDTKWVDDRPRVLKRTVSVLHQTDIDHSG